MSRLRLTINSDLEDVFLIGLAVSKICEYLKLDSNESSRIELCAVEAVTNSIRHAYGNQPGNEVSVTLVVCGNRLELEVCDRGAAMSAAHQSRLVQGSDVLQFNPNDHTSLPEGGMGLQIMHDVMDEVSYRSEGEVNSLQLIHLLRSLEHGDRERSPAGLRV